MTRLRSRQAESQDINERRYGTDSIPTRALKKFSITAEKLRPGLIGDVHLGGNIINETHIHPTTLADLKGAGQLLVLSASAASIASGGDHVTFDTIVAQHRFPDVIAAGESWTHPVDGVYSAVVKLRWDSYAGGGTIRLELDGVLIPEGLFVAGDSGDQALGVVQYKASAGSVARIKVTQSSGSIQTCSALVSAAITDPDPVAVTVEDPDWSLLFSADAWGVLHDGTQWWTTEGNSGDTVTARDAVGVEVSSFEVAMAGRVRGIAFDGTDLWVTGNNLGHPSFDSGLRRYSTAGDLLQTINTDTVGDANGGLTFDGTDLWFCEGDDERLVRITTAGSIELNVASPSAPGGMTYYGGSLWIVSRTDRLLVECNTSGVATGTTVDLSGLVNTPTGVWIAGDGTLYIACDADGVYQWLGGTL